MNLMTMNKKKRTSTNLIIVRMDITTRGLEVSSQNKRLMSNLMGNSMGRRKTKWIRNPINTVTEEDEFSYINFLLLII